MKIREALEAAARRLRERGFEDPHLEAELLLRKATGMSKEELYAELEREMEEDEALALEGLLKRRLNFEPIAYILGRREFYGIEFHVDRRAFIPRPETEILVDEALKVAGERFGEACSIADVGTGCGPIAISLAMNLPQAEIYAIDISAPALEVALINCKRYGLEGRVKLLCGNLLDPLPSKVDMIVANLPYIRSSEIERLDPEIRDFEPREALDGGEDGLRLLRELISQAPGKLREGGVLIAEMDPRQSSALAEWAKLHFPAASVRVGRDLSGLPRMLVVDAGSGES